MKGEPRLAELIASLSLATDLGLGLPQEHVLRQTVIAMRLAEAAGLDHAAQADTFYVSLLAWVGCIADSHELSRWFGDDRQIRADSYQVDKVGLPMMRLMLTHVGADAPPLRRITTIGRFLTGGFRDAVDGFVAHCQTTGDVADRLGMNARVKVALSQAFERWDGKGVPGTAGGEQIEAVMRVVQIADDAEVFCSTGGPDAAGVMLRSRRGSEFDPALVATCLAHSERIFSGLHEVDAWSLVIEACPDLDRPVRLAELDQMLEIFADYADLKSPWYLGHSRAVSALADAAAVEMSCSAADRALVRRAGLVHRLGATGVSTSIWNKPGRLSAAEQERVRQVPYFTERILSRQPTLAGIGSIAGMAFERSDGTGYPRGLRAAAIPVPARILAAAAAYQDLAEERPTRPALPFPQRRAALLADVDAGRLDAAAARAVLAAAGHAVGRRTRLVAGLTAREAEVLELLVRGLANKQIAARLSVTPRTVATHIEHVFTKTGVSTRGAAAMFALRHGLVDAGGTSAERPM
ncbi:regulatory protein, luxR family [Nakamurella panacisegetis]|uniref:Regulatory protein, luxR family n=1 Tax=Nakamurella panacisegetis TaxID=1090615 RepID=A0A1H0QPX1_9ACTN|nr:HD domain-containing phosphohydrolase [Nakamurella panacisegetis]SDP19230.1 regulatory protein, luxR family [Nakamurella panacisegetis]